MSPTNFTPGLVGGDVPLEKVRHVRCRFGVRFGGDQERARFGTKPSWRNRSPRRLIADTPNLAKYYQGTARGGALLSRMITLGRSEEKLRTGVPVTTASRSP